MAEEESAEERAKAAEEVQFVVAHLAEPKRSAITQAMMSMAPAARSEALAKLHEGVKGSFPGVGLHEEPPEIELPDEGEEEFEACAEFAGPREGCVFKSGEAGVGYYRDVRVPVGDVVAPPPAPQPAAAVPPTAAALSDEPCAELKSKGNALFKARKWSAPSTSSPRASLETAP